METDGQTPIYNIVGELVALGPVRRELLPLYQRWINDFSTLRCLGLPPRPVTLEAETDWYEKTAQHGDTVMFTIYEKSTGRPIGNTDLGPDYRNRSGWIGIVIGEADCRGKGYGTEAVRLMMDYGFTACGLHSLMLLVYEYNHAARRAYERAGFRECGRRRQCRMMGGRLWDEITMDCLATEFTSPALGKVLTPPERHAES